MNADDLGRTMGWEFSLMVCAVRLINSGLLDRFPTLKIQFSHFAGGVGRYTARIAGMQSRKSGDRSMPADHRRRPSQAFEYYLRERFFYDCAGWVSRGEQSDVAESWVADGLREVSNSRVVFGTDYPQACDDDQEVASLIRELRKSERAADALSGANARELIPKCFG
jgi:predicted TIM-barrel fold metal-dependent hydrolase